MMSVRTPMPKQNPHLLLVTIWVWNSDKFNITNIHKLFDLKCPFTLLESLKVVTCSMAVNLSVGDNQVNCFFMVITGQHTGLCDAFATKPAIHKKSDVSIRGVKITKSAPVKGLFMCELVPSNKVDHSRSNCQKGC
jgi:hypothetical protein